MTDDSYYLEKLSIFPKGSTILIIGDPTGKTKTLAERSGLNAISIDINPQSKIVLKKSATKTGMKKNYFDGVLFSHVIEHLPVSDVKKVVAEIYRVLKPGGKVVLATPIYSKIFWDDPTHVRPYTKWALRSLFNKGFREEKLFKRVRQRNLFGLKNHNEINMVFVKGN